MDKHTLINFEHYNQIASRYDSNLFFKRENRNHEKRFQKIVSGLNVQDGDHVLEVGVGTGIQAQMMVKNFPIQFTGIDLSDQMLIEARKRLDRNENARLLAANAQSLPFESNSFDGTYCSGIIHHLSDPAKGISEMARVTKIGRSVSIVEPNIFHPRNIYDALFVPDERNLLKVRLQTLKTWFAQAGLTTKTYGYFICFPPQPEKLFTRLENLEKRLCHSFLFRFLPLNIFISGTKE